MINYNIKIKFQENTRLYTDIVLTSGDIKAYRLNFSFYDNGKTYDTSNCILTIKAKRADGVIVTDAGIITSDGKSYYDLKNNIYSISGELCLEIALSEETGAYLTTKEIIMMVREGFGDGGITSVDTAPVLSSILTIAAQARDKADAAEIAVQEVNELTGQKADKQTQTGGFEAGADTVATYGGVAIGANAAADGGEDLIGGVSIGGNSISISGGGAVGNSAVALSGGGAVGYSATADSGGAIGNGAESQDGGGAIGIEAFVTYGGGAVGNNAASAGGGAVGAGAEAGIGFAGGKDAKTVDASGDAIDAIQLGTGTNNTPRSVQIYGNKLLDANGKMPMDRIADGAITGGKIADGAVTADKIANDAVTTNKLINKAVTAAKMADDIMATINAKANKQTAGGGFTAGEGASNSGTATGAAIGKYASTSDYGVAIGESAGGNGIAVGKAASASSSGAVAIGVEAVGASDGGVAIGSGAAAVMDGIQLGAGVNEVSNSLQIYDKQLLDADGYIPIERIADGTITDNKIEDGAITTDKIADGAITDDKIDRINSNKLLSIISHSEIDSKHPDFATYYNKNYLGVAYTNAPFEMGVIFTITNFNTFPYGWKQIGIDNQGNIYERTNTEVTNTDDWTLNSNSYTTDEKIKVENSIISDTINSIEVVDDYPPTETQGVLYLKKVTE